jgi:ribonuclease-3
LSSAFESVLGHEFARPELLREALTHRSAVDRRIGLSNDRLDLIGVRVLGLILAVWLAEVFTAVH